MQSTVIVKQSLEGKYGPQLLGEDGDYYSFGKFYKGNTSFTTGSKLNVELFVTESGRKYINKILESVVTTDSVTPNPTESKKRKYIKKEVINPETSKSPDWDGIARGKTRCLAITQLLSSVLPLVITNPQNMEEVKEKAKELADFAVEYSFSEE